MNRPKWKCQRIGIRWALYRINTGRNELIGWFNKWDDAMLYAMRNPLRIDNALKVAR